MIFLSHEKGFNTTSLVSREEMFQVDNNRQAEGDFLRRKS
jgi:hypothetical protein